MSRHFRLRRALRGGAILALSFAIVALAGVAFVRTPLGRASLRAGLERYGSRATGGTLRLGTVELTPWRGEATATAVTLAIPAAMLELQRIDVVWSPATGARVSLLRPRIVVRESNAARLPTPPADGLAARPWRVLEQVARLDVREGRLELRDAAGAASLVLGRFDLEVSSAGQRAALRVQDASVALPGARRIEPATADAQLALDGGSLSIESARVAVGGSELELHGRLQRIDPLGAGVSLHADLDGPLIDALAPGGALAGRVTASGGIEVADGRLSGTLEASSRALTVARSGPWSVSGRGHFEGARFVVETLTGVGFGGRVEVAGPLALSASAQSEVRLRASGLDVRTLARALGADLPLSARASADLVWTAQGWDIPSSRCEGRITLSPGGGLGLQPAGEATLRTLGLELGGAEARVEARGARATASVRIGAAGALSGSWAAELPLPAVSALLADLGGRTTSLPLAGMLVAQGDLAGSVSDPLVHGSVRGEGLAVGAEPLGLDAALRYRQGRLALSPLVVRSGSGQAALEGEIPFAASATWDLAGELQDVETRPLQAVLGLPGRGSATGTLRVTGLRNQPAARLAVRTTALLPRPAGEATADPDEVVIALEANSTGRRVVVEQLVAGLAGGHVRGSGGYDPARDALDVMLEADGVAWERMPLLPAPLRHLSGVLSGRLALAGRPQAPSGDLRLQLAEAAIDGAALPPLSVVAHADGGELRVEGSTETVFMRGHAPLVDDWPLEVELDTARLPLQALAAPYLARREATMLAASGTVTLSLPLREPSRIGYSSADLAASGRVGRIEWTLAPFSVRGDRESASIQHFRITAGRASLSLDGRVAVAQASPFDLQVEAELPLADLDPAPSSRSLQGDGRFSVAVTGTRAAPQLSGTLALTGVRGSGEDAALRDLELAARFVGRDLELDSLTADVLGGTVAARGRIPIVPGGERAALSFELRDVDLARLLEEDPGASEAPPALLVSLEGELEARALTLDGLSARGRLTRFEPRSGEGSLALVEPARFTLESRRFALAPLRLSGSLGDIQAHAEAELGGRSTLGTLAIAGGLDLRALDAFLPGASLSGVARIDARIHHDREAWRLDGGVALERARVSLDTLNFALSELSGGLRFKGDRVALEAEGVAGDGRLRARGELRLGPALLGPADVTLEAERVPVQYPLGYRGRASGSVRLTGGPDAYRLAGTVSMSQGYYTADVDAKTQSLDRLDWQLAALEGGALSDRIALDVNVRLADPLRVRNQTLQLDLEGGVTVSGTLAQPTAGGQVTLREGGELTLGRARLRVTQGRVELNGYPAGTPDVDFAGLTRVSGVALEVRARGALDNLELTLASDRSDLSQTDLMTLLLTGRTASAAASEGGVVVAEQLAVALGGVLQKGVGDTLLIDVSPDHSLLSDDTDPTQRFHIGTRVTQNVNVIYSAALDGTEKRWILEFNPAGGRFRVRAISEEDNSLSLEASDRFAFNLWSRGGSAPREIDRLVAVRFEGDLKLAQDELRAALKLKQGRRSSGLQREQAADRARARLVRAGYRSASVDAVTQRVPHGVELVLRVEAGPLVAIEWTGDDAGEAVREAALRDWPPLAIPELAATQVARAVRIRLQGAGYYAAEVTAATTQAADRVTVRLAVSRGPLGKRVELEFDGNEAVDAKTLAAALPKPGSLEFFDALDARGARIANALRLAYAGVGYLRVRVGVPRTTLDASSGTLRVTVTLQERGASRVAALELPAEAAQARDLALRLQRGQPFDLAAYLADRDALTRWYHARGWVEARLGGVLEPRGPDIAVRFEADPGPRPRVAAIRLDNTGKTRAAVIRRSLSVREGEPLQPIQLADSRERLSEIGVFRSVDVRAEPRASDPGLRDVVVELVDKPDLQLEYGLRYTTAGEGGGAGGAPSSPSEARLQLAAAAELTNPFGFGVKTRAYGFGTTDRQTWGVTLDAATLAGVRLRTQLFVFDDNDDDVEISGLASHVRGTTLQQSRALLRDRRGNRWHDRLRLQWGYTFKDIEYIESAQDQRVLQGDRGFLSLSLIGDKRDSLTDPARGIFWTATTELTRTWLGSDVDYVRLYGQFFAYLPVGPFVWAQGYRVGRVPGADPLLLIENRFRAGGPTTVRGFEQNALGPATAAGDSLGGQAVLVLNQELRFPIFRNLKGGAFWDAGNVWLTAPEFDAGDLRHSVGAGLRYIFPFGPVRLEYAWILGRRNGEPTGRIVFGLGHAF